MVMGGSPKVRRTMQLFQLEGKTALVTGGGGIYGVHIVRALAEAGAHVIVASRDTARCGASAQELCAEGLSAEAAALDLTSESSIRGLRERILGDHGRLDVMVNNAVARSGGAFRHASAAEWETAMKVNSTGLFLPAKFSPSPGKRRGPIRRLTSHLSTAWLVLTSQCMKAHK
jgi:NAD(P)-dependent dehydrogenase (short-subunit alcohol dehydrogenase family)